MILRILVFSLIIRNIVSTVNLDCKLDLKAIALQARNAEYNPKVSFDVENECSVKQVFFLIRMEYSTH